jgi:predicted dehydrogenase
MLVGGPYHLTDEAGKVLREIIEKWGGRWQLTVTTDLDALASLPASDYAAVIINTTGFDDALTPAREKGLTTFVKSGRGFVGIHSAICSFRNNPAYVDMINGAFLRHPEFEEFPVNIVDPDHYVTVRMPDFTIADELYLLKEYDPARCHVMAETSYQGKKAPMAYVRPYGKGRVFFLALGHDLRAWRHPEFQRLLMRGLEWTQGAEVPKKEIACGVLGYGPACNQGKGHVEWIGANRGLKAVAMADIDPTRLPLARKDYPGIRTLASGDEMLKQVKDLDLVSVVIPHNLHADFTIKCLRAGKHVVCEKPFCVTTEEATSMIRAARRAGRMLSVFQNRRWDGDFVAVRDIVARGLVGDLYHLEAAMVNYQRPGPSWRSDKTISGGQMYDWGAHFVDWTLRFFNKRVTQVTGFFHKRVWNHVTIEDATQAILRFEGGQFADIQQSYIAAVGKPKWRLLGTKGGIIANWADTVELTSFTSGLRLEAKVPAKATFGCREYYRNIADHLLLGEPLEVRPEEAREAVAVMETAERSSAEGRSLPLPSEVYEDL